MENTPLVQRTKFSSINPDGEAQLEQAVVDTYDAVVDPSHPAADLDEDAAWLREQRISHKSLHWLRRPSVVMIGCCLFMFSFASSSAESTRQMLTFKLACNYVLHHSTLGICDPTETQVLVSSLQQGYAIAAGITTLFASGKIGPLSDQYGRKMFIVLIALLQIIGKTLRLVVMTHYPELQFGAMVFTEVVTNLCGGTITLVTLACCYVSDIAEAHQRTYYLGINIASLFVGLSTGPLAGNLILSLAKKFGITGSISELFGLSHSEPATTIDKYEFAPLRAEIGILCLVFLFVILVLPESRTESARRKSRSLSTSLLRSSLLGEEPVELSAPSRFFQMFNFLRPLRLIAYPKDVVSRLRHQSIRVNRVAVILLIISDCFITSISIPMGELYVLYGIYRFGWKAPDLGIMLAVTCSSRAFALIVLSPVISRKLFQETLGLRLNPKRFDRVDWAMVTFAFVCEFIGLLWLSTAQNSVLFLIILSLTSFGTLGGPALGSAVVKFFPELKIGELFGAMALVKNVLQVIVPVAILAIYKALLSRWLRPQLVFYVIALIFLGVALSAGFVIRILEREDNRVKTETDVEQNRRPSVHHHRNSSFS